MEQNKLRMIRGHEYYASVRNLMNFKRQGRRLSIATLTLNLCFDASVSLQHVSV